MRDHEPITIEEFNGLWRRGEIDSTPPDHFSDCNNIQFIQSGFKSRDGINIYADFPNIVRMYTFIQETGSSLLILDDQGNIYDSGSPTPLIPVLSITGMLDFGYVSIAGRAYLSPNDGVKGLVNEVVYVYDGDGTAARPAAGAAPIDAEGALAAANSGTAGNVEAGIHVFAAVYETSSGFLSSYGPDTLPTVTADGTKKVDISNIPVSLSAAVTKVHIVATKAINPLLWDGNTRGYQFFFIPGAEVNNGTTTLTVNFYDAELLEDASYLEDLFEEIPAGAFLSTYRGRMIVGATFDNISVDYVSAQGEPEAINQVDGLLIIPLDGIALTFAQEFRDVLYTGKPARTYAYVDNGDVPSSWQVTVLDQGFGASLHGIATVIDSGGVNLDYLIMVNYSGIVLFNGTFIDPELTWKINDLWIGINKDDYNRIQILNDTILEVIYVVLPDGTMLIGDYTMELSAKEIKWSPWSFPTPIDTIAFIDNNTLLLGSTGNP